jgi:chromosome segregation ATPase
MATNRQTTTHELDDAVANAPQKIVKIQSNIEKLDEKMETVANKIQEVKKVIADLQSRKTLYTNDDPVKELQFQILLLTNDRNYLAQAKKLFIAKINDDYFELASELVLLVSTMASLEFKDSTDDDSLIKKIQTVKKNPDVTTSFKTLGEIVQSLVNNLDLIRHFLMEFDSYINGMRTKVASEIYHCSGLHPELLFKHQSIHLEYTKFSNMVKSLTEYYSDLSGVLLSQAHNMKIADFCGTSKQATPEPSPIDISPLVTV